MNNTIIELRIENLSKKFIKDWIFRDANLNLKSGNQYVFTGANGSGKSTLMLCLTGQMPVTNGKISVIIENKIIEDNIWDSIVFTAPYLELIEDFTLIEFLIFHASFKPFRDNLNPKDLVSLIGLENSIDKPIKYFSSGMKQRVKLALCFYTNCPIVFFDEPTTNLDQNGIDWYRKTIVKECKNKLVLIFSNQLHEYDFTQNIFVLSNKSINKIA
jgi:ABC-type multidrug transport system ATPase subunit